MLKFYYCKDTIFFTVSITKTEKNREYLFNPCYLCSQNGSVPSLHSLSIRLFRKHCKLTIFNSFNFIAHEFSAGGNLLEIFRVFEGLAKDCISTPCKHIENRPEKDGVLTVEKRRFFRKNEELVVLKRSLSSQKTSFSSEKTPCFSREGLKPSRKVVGSSRI